MHDQDTGTLLRRLRLEAGVDPAAGGGTAGRQRSGRQQVGAGPGLPDVGMLPRLAKIFGVSVEGILDGDLLPAAPDGGNMKKIQFLRVPGTAATF